MVETDACAEIVLVAHRACAAVGSHGSSVHRITWTARWTTHNKACVLMSVSLCDKEWAGSLTLSDRVVEFDARDARHLNSTNNEQKVSTSRSAPVSLLITRTAPMQRTPLISHYVISDQRP